MTRRAEGEYRQYLTEKQRRQVACSADRMQRDFHHGLLVDPAAAEHGVAGIEDDRLTGCDRRLRFFEDHRRPVAG